MNLENYYWYFMSAIPERICDDIIRYGEQQASQVALTGDQTENDLTNQKDISKLSKEALFMSLDLYISRLFSTRRSEFANQLFLLAI